MKAFNGTRIGIPLHNDPKLGLIVGLGELGRGRIFTKIKMDNRSAPKIEYDRLMEAGVKSFKIGENQEFFTFTASKENDNRAIVRISSNGTYTRNTNGYSKVYWGTPKLVCSGMGAYGAAGRIGSWQDCLYIMSEGDAILNIPSGGYKVKPEIYLYHNGSVSVWDPKEFRATYLRGIIENASAEEREAFRQNIIERNDENLFALLNSVENQSEMEL